MKKSNFSHQWYCQQEHHLFDVESKLFVENPNFLLLTPFVWGFKLFQLNLTSIAKFWNFVRCTFPPEYHWMVWASSALNGFSVGNCGSVICLQYPRFGVGSYSFGTESSLTSFGFQHQNQFFTGLNIVTEIIKVSMVRARTKLKYWQSRRWEQCSKKPSLNHKIKNKYIGLKLKTDTKTGAKHSWVTVNEEKIQIQQNRISISTLWEFSRSFVSLFGNGPFHNP